MKRLIHQYLAFLTASLIVLTACEKEPAGLGSEPDKAKIIFVNAAPNGATDPALARREIAIYPFYNEVTFNNFPIKFPWSNGYKAFEPGTMTVRLDTARSIGNDPPGPNATVAQVTFETQADVYYSVYAVGTVQNVEALVLTDDLSLPTPGRAKVRIMNFSPDAGPVDLVITGGAPSLVTLATNLQFKGVQAFIEIDPGRYTIEVRAAGTTTRIGGAGGSRGDVLIEPNSCYSIWTAGFQTLPSSGVTLPFHAFNIRYHANRWSNPLVQ
jgi:hypothetical protein